MFSKTVSRFTLISVLLPTIQEAAYSERLISSSKFVLIALCVHEPLSFVAKDFIEN